MRLSSMIFACFLSALICEICGEGRPYCGGAIRLLRSSLATTPSRMWTTR